MAGKVKTWVWVVAAVVIVGILGVIAAAGVGVYFFSRHVETRTASPAVAAQDFGQISTRFGQQKPLIELDQHGNYLGSNTDRQALPGAPRPETLRVMAFDPDDGRVVRVAIPFWLLRLKLKGSSIDFAGNRVQLEDLKLTVEDLERYGSTLVIDHLAPSGQRVIVWTE